MKDLSQGIFSSKKSIPEDVLEKYRTDDMSRIGFWIVGPGTSTVVLLAAWGDLEAYPLLWSPRWLLWRLGIIPFSAIAMLVLKSKAREKYGDFFSCLVGGYVAVFAAILISETGYGKSLFGHIYIQIILGASIVPLKFRNFLALISSALALYFFLLYFGPVPEGLIALSINVSTFQSYFLLALLIYYSIYRARRATYQSRHELEIELLSRQKKIDSLVAHELFAKEAEIKMNISRQVAHDIRSPLTALNTVLSQKDLNSPDAKSLLEESVKRVSKIASDLLSPQQPSLKENVKTLTEKIIDQKRAELNIDQNKIEFLCASDELQQVDSNAYERILSNLINNAYESLKDKEGKIKIELHTKNQKNILKITDNGCGIPPHILHKIGQKGFTTKHQTGHGLGLSYCFDVVKSWGGNINIESTPNEGTTVTIEWPA